MTEDVKPVIGFFFAPDWAKDGYRPPPADKGHSERGERQGRRHDGRSDGQDRQQRFPSRAPNERQARPRQRREGDERRHEEGAGHSQRQEHESRPKREAPLPLTFAFLPRELFARNLAMKVRHLGLAFPLFELARMFLKHSKSFVVDVAAPEGMDMWQVRPGEQVFFDERQAEEHAFAVALETIYQETVEAAPPPQGNWLSVVRCRLDGTLLGPVNYHGYRDAERRLWMGKFKDMPYDRFLQSLETVRDPESIEVWLKKVSVSRRWTRTVSHRSGGTRERKAERGAPAGDDVQVDSSVPSAEAADSVDTDTAPVAPISINAENADETLTFGAEIQLRSDFMRHVLPRMLHKVTTARVPGHIAWANPSPAFVAALEDAWNREGRFPMEMANRFRGHLKRAGLHVFKTRRNETLVAVAEPMELDPALVSPAIEAIVDFVKHDPAPTRLGLFEAHFDMPSAEAAGTAGEGSSATLDTRSDQIPESADSPVEDSGSGVEKRKGHALRPETVSKCGRFTAAEMDADLSMMIRQGYLIELSVRRLIMASDLVRPRRPDEPRSGVSRTDRSNPTRSAARNEDLPSEADADRS